MLSSSQSGEGSFPPSLSNSESITARDLVEIKSAGVVLKGNLVKPDKSNKPLVLISQGAGKDQNPVEYFASLQEILATHGYGSLVLHTQGVGKGEFKSGGNFNQATLKVRQENLRDGLEFLAQGGREVVLLTGSMNGHPAMELASEWQERLAAFVLFEPAIYPAECETATLGDGSQFQKIVRGIDLGLTGSETKEEIRANPKLNKKKLASPAISALNQYRGPVFLAYGEFDDVIDPLIQDRLRLIVDSKGASGQIFSVSGKGHKLLTNGTSQLYDQVVDFLDQRYG